MEYRRITIDEIDRVAAFAIRGMRPDRYPLHMDPARVVATIRHFAGSTTDFHLAAFEGTRMVGGVALLVTPMLWFERAEAHVVMLFADAPGAGFRLLREAMRWASAQPGIRRVLWPLEDDADVARLARIAARFGFNRGHQVLLAYKE